MEYINGNILLVINIVVINSLKLEGSLEFMYQFMGTLGFLCSI